MTVRKRVSLTQGAAWGHGKHSLAASRMNAQGIAARLAVTTYADRVNLAVEIDGDRRRSPDAAIQRAQRHGIIAPDHLALCVTTTRTNTGSIPGYNLKRSGTRSASAITRQHKVSDAWGNLGAETRTVEHPIMPNGRLHVVNLVFGRNIDAQRVRRLGLADARDIVVLPFHRHQSHALDSTWFDGTAAMGHFTLRQCLADEPRADRLQIATSLQIHHSQIFVVELTMFLRGIAVAFDQVQEQIVMRLDMAVEVHAHEAVQLQKARIDVTHHARMRERHLGDDVITEPVEPAPFGQIVHSVGIDSRVNRPAHQHHRMRYIRVVVSFHQRDRRHDWHRWLAHGDHVNIATEHV